MDIQVYGNLNRFWKEKKVSCTQQQTNLDFFSLAFIY